VDIRRFGGLGRAMPVTAVTFGLGYLAIIGFPGFAGFFSKDLIIESAFNRPGWTGWLLGGIALGGAGLTAVYMSRLYFLTFLGRPRWTDDAHPHESPKSMTIPMVVLAVGSVAGGFGLQALGLLDWLRPVFGRGETLNQVSGEVHRLGPVLLTTMTLAVVAIGIGTAYVLFLRRPVAVTVPATTNPLVVAARRDLYANLVNEALFMRPGQYLARALVYVDSRGVDGLVNSLAATVGGGSARLRRMQTGFVRSYALTMLGGAVLVVAALLVVRVG
jgi:NADH-quinone oxidoreductase subunit L